MLVYEIVPEHSQLTCCDMPWRAGCVLPVREELGATKGKNINSLTLCSNLPAHALLVCLRAMACALRLDSRRSCWLLVLYNP